MKSGTRFIESAESIIYKADAKNVDLLMQDLGCRLLIFHIPSLSTEDKRLLEQIDPMTSSSESYRFFKEITNMTPANVSQTFRVFTRIADTSQFVVVAKYSDGSSEMLKHSTQLKSLSEFSVSVPSLDQTKQLDSLIVRFSAAFERNWKLEVAQFKFIKDNSIDPIKNISHRMGSNLSVLQSRDDYSNEYVIEFGENEVGPVSLEVKVKFRAETIQRRLFFAQFLLIPIVWLIVAYWRRRN